MANGHGGVRPGAGRPSKADEEKVNSLFARALKEIYKKSDDDEAKVAFIKDFIGTDRGQLFIAQHVFGKPTDKVDIKGDPIIKVEYIGK